MLEPEMRKREKKKGRKGRKKGGRMEEVKEDGRKNERRKEGGDKSVKSARGYWKGGRTKMNKMKEEGEHKIRDNERSDEAEETVG